jgi:hypothetical protein
MARQNASILGDPQGLKGYSPIIALCALPMRRLQTLFLPRILLFLAATFGGLTSASWAQSVPPSDLRAAHDPALQRSLEGVVRDLGLESQLAQRHLALALVDVTDIVWLFNDFSRGQVDELAGKVDDVGGLKNVRPANRDPQASFSTRKRWDRR